MSEWKVDCSMSRRMVGAVAEEGNLMRWKKRQRGRQHASCRRIGDREDGRFARNRAIGGGQMSAVVTTLGWALVVLSVARSEGLATSFHSACSQASCHRISTRCWGAPPPPPPSERRGGGFGGSGDFPWKKKRISSPKILPNLRGGSSATASGEKTMPSASSDSNRKGTVECTIATSSEDTMTAESETMTTQDNDDKLKSPPRLGKSLLEPSFHPTLEKGSNRMVKPSPKAATDEKAANLDELLSNAAVSPTYLAAAARRRRRAAALGAASTTPLRTSSSFSSPSSLWATQTHGASSPLEGDDDFDLLRTNSHDDNAFLTNDEDDDEEFDGPIPTEYIAETRLPTDLGQYRLRAYRVVSNGSVRENPYVGKEPCVIFSHLPSTKTAVPVRIHDQCFTSEVFHSQRCDCREQLKLSLDYIREHGGAVIYLQQEGRGIGLANKIAAYALQDVGMDTVEANVHLGFPEDCRQYGVVPDILRDLGIESIQLMTNNPRKVDRLTKLGVDVVDTIPVVVPKTTVHNRRYLETKRDRMSHQNFGDLLSSSSKFSTDTLANGQPPAKRNGVMTPLVDSHLLTKEYLTNGDEMAKAAVQSAFFGLPVNGVTAETTLVVEEEEPETDGRAGVSASSDGYCFGPQSVEDAVAAIARGEMVVVVDDENRENEGDFILAAEKATPELMGQLIRYSSGVVCVAMEGERLDQLHFPPMVKTNEDPKGTAFAVSVDAHKKHGISTGISASDRAKTLNLLSSSETTANDFCRPGHIFPLRAREGGVLTRDGHTEASVDLARMAGCAPCGVLCEIVSEEDATEMARLPELRRFCRRHGFVMTSIVDIAQYRRDYEI